MAGYIWLVGWQADPPPEPVLVLNLISATLVLLIGFKDHLPTAIVLAALVLVPSAHMFVPRSRLGWGVATLAAGFIALLSGVLLNLRNRLTAGS